MILHRRQKKDLFGPNMNQMEGRSSNVGRGLRSAVFQNGKETAQPQAQEEEDRMMTT